MHSENMRTRFPIVVSLFLALALARPSGAEITKAKTASRSLDAVVKGLTPRLVGLVVERKRERRLAPTEEQLRGLTDDEKKDLRAYFRRPAGPASGLLIDGEGHVLTSLYNVAGEIRKIEVRLADGTTSPATVLARDVVDDLALLKLEKPIADSLTLPPLSWGESFQTGRFVLAIGVSGEPGGTTVTLGIISAPGRNGGRMFQTDAALNYGNAGGPIVDLEGRVMGIAAFIGHFYPYWGMNSGIGFGVRADTIRKVLPVLLDGKDIVLMGRPVLGVYPPKTTAEESEEKGARIGRVVPDSGSAAAGLEDSDVIVEFGDVIVEDFSHLRQLIMQRKPGETVPIKVRRGDKTLDLRVVLGEVKETDS